MTSGVPNSVSAGTHTVSEIIVSGYMSSIGGDCDLDGTITLADGDNKTCIITNDDTIQAMAVGGVVQVRVPSDSGPQSASPADSPAADREYGPLVAAIAAAVIAAAAGAWFARRRLLD